MGAIGKSLLMVLVALRVVNVDVGNKPKSVMTYFQTTPAANVVRIGIIPFTNLSDDQNADEKLLHPLITYMLSTGKFQVIDPAIIEQTLIENKIRSLAELNIASAQKIMADLKMKYVMVGTITTYKNEQKGSDTYPIISVSVRILNLEDLSIAWATSISRTGKDRSLLFDMGRIDTLEGLTTSVVNEIASTLGKNHERFLEPPAPAAAEQEGAAQGVPAADAQQGSAQPAAKEAPEQAGAPKTPKIADGQELAEADMIGLVPDVGEYSKDEVVYEGGRFHAVAFTRYRKNGTLFLVDVTDYGNSAESVKFMGLEHPTTMPITLEGFNAYISKSKFELAVIEVPVGRFVVKVSGRQELEGELKKFAAAVSRGFVK